MINIRYQVVLAALSSFSGGVLFGQSNDIHSSTANVRLQVGNQMPGADEFHLPLPRMALRDKNDRYKFDFMHCPPHANKLFALSGRGSKKLNMWDLKTAEHQEMRLSVFDDTKYITSAYDPKKRSVVVVGVTGSRTSLGITKIDLSPENGEEKQRISVDLDARLRPDGFDGSPIAIDYSVLADVCVVRFRRGTAVDSWVEVYSLSERKLTHAFCPHNRHRDNGGGSNNLFDCALDTSGSRLLTIGSSEEHANLIRMWNLVEKKPRLLHEAVVVNELAKESWQYLKRVFWISEDEFLTFESNPTYQSSTWFRKWSISSGAAKQVNEWYCVHKVEEYTSIVLSPDRRYVSVSNEHFGGYPAIFSTKSGEEVIHSNPGVFFRDFEQHGCFAPGERVCYYFDTQAEINAVEFSDVEQGRKLKR